MADSETLSYYQSPLFQEAMRHFQSGSWEDGLNRLAEVEKLFPLNVELRTLRQEMQVRAHIEELEVIDGRIAFRKKLFFYGSRVAVGVLLVLAIVWGAVTYFNWIQQRWQMTMNVFNQQVASVETSVKYRNAQDLLQAGYATEALQLFEELKATNPELEGLDAYLNEAKTLKTVGDRYAEALGLLKAGDEQAALDIFKSIQNERPQYRDVALQVQLLESQVELSDVLRKGDEAFQQGKWLEAITAYEALRALDTTYQTDHITSQLFQSYLSASEDALNEPEPSLEALQTAEDYFSRALSLRPQDNETLSRRAEVRNTITTRLVNKYIQEAESALIGQSDSLAALDAAQGYFMQALELRPDDTMILTKFQMAQNYLAAIDAYSKGKWTDVISFMQKVVILDPAYASGTARQSLYEALVARGDDYTAAGDYLLALADFQQAAILARQMTDSMVGQFEAQTRIAETQGLLGNQKDAVLIYQAALESAGLRQAILVADTPLKADLREAENYALKGDYQRSFALYRKVMTDWVAAVGTEDYQVKAGDYLPMLARRYHTTVSAILAANGMTARFTLQPDTQIQIPTSP